jgi:hypothetical protein
MLSANTRFLHSPSPRSGFGQNDSGLGAGHAPLSRATLLRMIRPPDRRLLNYLSAYDPHISDLTLALREVVLQEAPDAIESIVKTYAVSIGFSFTGKPLKDGFCHIVTYPSHVNLGFNRGALLPDPNKVLLGKGKAIRHITIKDQSELGRPFVRRYLQAAIEQVGTPPHR